MQPTMRRLTKRDYAPCCWCGQAVPLPDVEIESVEGHADMRAFECPKCSRKNYIETETEGTP